MATLNWKKISDNGYLGNAGKTHGLGVNNKTVCGKAIPNERSDSVEVEYFDSNYTDCKVCCKKLQTNPDLLY